MSRSWDKADEFGSDILGQGNCWGNIAGKVKTAQIGFVRNDGKPGKKNVYRKGSISNKGRGKTDAARCAKTRR